MCPNWYESGDDTGLAPALGADYGYGGNADGSGSFTAPLDMSANAEPTSVHLLDRLIDPSLDQAETDLAMQPLPAYALGLSDFDDGDLDDDTAGSSGLDPNTGFDIGAGGGYDPSVGVAAEYTHAGCNQGSNFGLAAGLVGDPRMALPGSGAVAFNFQDTRMNNQTPSGPPSVGSEPLPLPNLPPVFIPGTNIPDHWRPEQGWPGRQSSPFIQNPGYQRSD